MKATKSLSKEKDIELQSIKSDCAATLLGKEKSNQLKNRELETQVVDLKYEIQKYIQKINDLEAHQSDALEQLQENLNS